MDNPQFSILIPSRNRHNLLAHAISSVLMQDYSNFEIVVSDNASDKAYDSYDTFDGIDIKFIRSEDILSVTENWNRALEAATGEYIIMLGDDDAITPGLLKRLDEMIRGSDQPDAVYLMAYHYAYPGVYEAHPAGYFCAVNNSPLFDLNSAPFILDTARARQLGRRALNFKHQISFNAQHFVYRRSYISGLGVKPFYQSPYPDYFTCFVTFMTAKRILVVPSPQIIIGISRQSFGFYLASNKEAEGFKQFHGENISADALSAGDAKTRDALNHLGSGHTRNWLIASLFAKRALSNHVNVNVDLRRYCRLQTFELALRADVDTTFGRVAFREHLETVNEVENGFGKKLLWLSAVLRRTGGFSQTPLTGLSSLLGVYHSPKITTVDIGPHTNILDAFNWLKDRPPENVIRSRPPEKGVALEPEGLQAALARRDHQLDNLKSELALNSAKVELLCQQFRDLRLDLERSKNEPIRNILRQMRRSVRRALGWSPLKRAP